MAAVLLWTAIAVDFAHNLFDWDPGTGPAPVDGIALSVYGVSLWAVTRLVARTRGRVRTCFALPAVAAPVAFGLSFAGAEPTSERWFLGRDRPSPATYRYGRAALLSVPAAMLAWTLFRRRIVSRPGES